MKTRQFRSKTYFGTGVLGILIVLTTICAFSQAREARKDERPNIVLLADGTPIHLVLMDDLEGKLLLANQTVHFKVRQDILVGSTLVVKTGAEAIGHIELVSRSGLTGKSGRLVLQLEYVNTVSGAKIPLRGTVGVGGGKGGALTWESALWYGPDASLPVGTMINGYVNQDQRISAL